MLLLCDQLLVPSLAISLLHRVRSSVTLPFMRPEILLNSHSRSKMDKIPAWSQLLRQFSRQYFQIAVYRLTVNPNSPSVIRIMPTIILIKVVFQHHLVPPPKQTNDFTFFNFEKLIFSTSVFEPIRFVLTARPLQLIVHLSCYTTFPSHSCQVFTL